MNPTKGRRILLATDLSARCDRAFERAVILAREWNARLTIVSALEGLHEGPDRGPGPRWTPIDREKIEAESQISSDLHRAGIAADIVVRRGTASELILDVAHEISCDLVVTGIARDSGLRRAIMGATLESLVRQSLAPVLIVKRPARETYRSAVVGTNFTSASRAAIQATDRLLRPSTMAVLHAYRLPVEGIGGVKVTDNLAYHHAFEACARFVAEALPGGAQGTRCVAEFGFPETLLNQYALDRRVDLIAVGTKARTLVTDLLFGNVSRALILSSPCDLLLVPAGWRSGFARADTHRLREASLVGGLK